VETFENESVLFQPKWKKAAVEQREKADVFPLFPFLSLLLFLVKVLFLVKGKAEKATETKSCKDA
jgi:hypothetical protein